VCFSPDGTLLATGASDFKIRVRVLSCRSLTSIRAHELFILSPPRNHPSQLAYPVYRQIWDIATKRILSTFEGHENIVLSLEFSSDTRLIFSGSVDYTVRIWDMETGQHTLLSITAPSDVRFILTYHCVAC
jgi:WD40 repeat protein